MVFRKVQSLSYIICCMFQVFFPREKSLDRSSYCTPSTVAYNIELLRVENPQTEPFRIRDLLVPLTSTATDPTPSTS